MKYIVMPPIAVIIFIIVLIWTLDYKQARLAFRDIIDPKGFHTLDN